MVSNTSTTEPSRELTGCLSTVCALGRPCVPSWGPVTADIMFVFTSPGFRDLEQLRPLAGPSGRVFDQLLSAAGLKRTEVFMAYTIACADFEREDRRPLPSELELCQSRLFFDIHTVKPKVIVAMGNLAIANFFPSTTVSKMRGKIRNWRGTPVVATYDPAFAAPHMSPQVVPLIVDDILTAKSLII